ncbi:MAG: zinc-ribbon domain-containing protein [Clostridia bacterium]|nr:zinc-ribbon domain-containing protein [Clostridia bacterium]
MQRFCPNCGTALDEEMMFCPSCGSPVPQPQFASQRANVYPQYSPAPSASSQPLRGAPGVSKVMVILYLVTFGIAFILNAVAVARYGGSFNNGLNLILNVTFGFTAAILLLLGVFIRKAPALYGAGLIVLAVQSVVSMARTLIFGGGGASAGITLILDLACLLLFVVPLIVASFHYFTKGRGIKGGLKNAMTVLGLVFVVLSDGYELFEMIRFAVTYGSSGSIFIQSICTVFVSLIGSVFLFIATLAFTVRRKTV